MFKYITSYPQVGARWEGLAASEPIKNKINPIVNLNIFDLMWFTLKRVV